MNDEGPGTESAVADRRTSLEMPVKTAALLLLLPFAVGSGGPTTQAPAVLHEADSLLPVDRSRLEASLARAGEPPTWTERLTIPPHRIWVLDGDHFSPVALDPSALVSSQTAAGNVVLEGVVQVATDRQPVAGASVRLVADDGYVGEATSDESGRFSLGKLSEGAAGRLTVEAEGFQRVRLEGLLRSLLAKPLILEPAPRLCVEVTDSETRAAVSAYTLSLFREVRSAHVVYRDWGPSRRIDDPEGRGCIGGTLPAPWLLQITRDGYAPASLRVVEYDPQPIAVELTPEARVQALVRDGAGDPIAGAEVKAVSSAADRDPLSRQLEQDVSGRISTSNEVGEALLRALVPETHVIEVAHPGFVLWRGTKELRAGDNEVAVQLDAGSSLRVLVRSEDTGSPIAGALVGVQPMSDTLFPKSDCETDTSGSCSVRGLALGRYVVSAQAEGYSGGQTRVTMSEGHEAVAAELSLEKGIEVRGKVLGVDEYPTVEFDVAFSVPGFAVVVAAVDDTGVFHRRGVPSGSASAFVIARETRAVFVERGIEVPRGGPLRLMLRLPSPLVVDGRVTVADKRPCGACRVSFIRQGAEAGSTTVYGSVGPDGRYSVRLPAPGTYRVEVEDERSKAAHAEFLEIFSSVTADWHLEGTAVAGRVFRDRGEPAPAAAIELRDRAGRRLRTTIAGAAGDFRFDDLGIGEYTVVALSGGAVARELINVVGDTEPHRVDLMLPATQGMRLRLLDPTSGVPVSVVSALLVGADGATAWVDLRRTDPDGWTEVPALEAEPLTVVVKASGSDYAVSTLRGLVQGQQLEFAMPLARSFSVEVAESLQPCALEVREPSGQSIALGVDYPPGPVPFTVRNGVFNRVPPGNYTVTLVGCTGAQLTQPVALQPGLIPTLRFGYKSAE